jgi:FKBP-type peptidyl-prolyl cis-trans isomerase
MDVVEKIALVPGNPATGKPNDEVIIEDIELYNTVEGKEVTYVIKDTQKAKEQAIENNKKLAEAKQEALKTKVAASGDTVGVKYRLTLNDGTQVDGNFDSDNVFDFTIDQQGIITGFSDAVK